MYLKEFRHAQSNLLQRWLVSAHFSVYHQTCIPQPMKETTHFFFYKLYIKIFLPVDGFGSLVVSMLASGTQVCGFKPGRSLLIFRA